MRSPRSKDRARTLFLVLNGKKIGDEALREAIKRVRCSLAAAVARYRRARRGLHLSFPLRENCLLVVIHLRLTHRQEGHRVEIRVTYEAEDSERYVLEALRQKGVDTIIAAGGDGMVNQVGQSLCPFSSGWPSHVLNCL